MKNGLKIISLTGLLLILAGLNSAFGQDWPQWRGSKRDGKIVGFTAPAAWPEKLAQEWKKTAEEIASLSSAGFRDLFVVADDWPS